MLFGGRCDLCGRTAVGLCGPCRHALEPADIPDLTPEIDAIVAVFAYTGSGSELIRAMKFTNRRRSLPVLVAAAVRAVTTPFDVVVPVPAEPNRRRRRGYDLPELIAGEVAGRGGLPVRQPLRRIDHGTQRRRGRVERTTVDAYEFRSRVAGAVLLVDDVVTTGATARQCAAELRRAGADSVSLLVLASTPLATGSSPPDLTATIKASHDPEVTPTCRSTSALAGPSSPIASRT